ncbi:MAG: KH domain-containing protein [Chloroflexia bacterium]|nr:KH domain-containing protein [Chloroflexia bacterium]
MGDDDGAVVNDPASDSSDSDPLALAATEIDSTIPLGEPGEAVESLRELVVYLIENLVEDPEQVSVIADQRGSVVQVQVRLPEAELGRVIGRGGRIAKAIRTALMIAGSRHHLRVSLDIES